ncbi:hypothetical protein F7725_016642 [Dissostichus mawsoni]|uniref:Inter-alpha-trypsin inhibitor heavy chain C-terminal domain-containing protein n=1 Tax=Dissostichus mawsoni TaxID=36200 RepID=A0A7J5Z4A7_DISMA|nr:hypothetical protein F7725_016642 [Dissostichus mawsoni]
MTLNHSQASLTISLYSLCLKCEFFTEQRQNEERVGYQRFQQVAAVRPVSNYYHSTPTYLVDGDPHFLIELPERDDALCFNINDKPGTIFNLVRDPIPGILVNGEIIGDKMIPPDGQINTYFWRFGIVHQSLGVRLEVSTQDIVVLQDGKQVKLLWSDNASVKGTNVDLLLTKDRSLTVTLKDSVKFVVLLHKVWAKHPYHQDYLGFYTLDSHLLSPLVHGLLGQFYHGIEYEVSELRPGEVPEKPDATMYVKGRELNVTRGWQRDFRKDVKNGENVPCWFVHSNGTGLIDGDATEYVVSGLFKTQCQCRGSSVSHPCLHRGESCCCGFVFASFSQLRRKELWWFLAEMIRHRYLK